MKVESGPEGYAQFLQDVRELFGITADLEMELTFDCAEPATGVLMTLPARDRPRCAWDGASVGGGQGRLESALVPC